MKRLIIALTAVVLLINAVFASADIGRKDVLPQPFNPLGLTRFADELESRLSGKCVGYQFIASYRDGQSIARAGGVSRRAPDAGPRKMTVDEKYNIASVSKTITAVAALKLLDEKKISIDRPIHPYLPPEWDLGKHVETITFRELLTHRSGIRGEDRVDFAALRDTIENGIVLADKKKGEYKNTNYALFRILIPRITGFKGVIPSPKGVKPPPQNVARNYGIMYMAYVQNNVFAPAGLTGVECKPSATPGLCYQYPQPKIQGEDFGDDTETSGSQGWNMSSRQLSRFFTALLYSEKIVPQRIVQRMRTEGLGLYRQDSIGYFTTWHHGGFFPGKKKDGSLWNRGQLGAVILEFNNGVHVSMIINSQLGPGLQSETEIRAAMKEVLQ